MNRGIPAYLGVIALWLAAGIGATLSLRMTGSVLTPNLVLVVLGTVGLHLTRRAGIALGFLGGFFEASLAGANMLPYLLTRTLVGLVVASFGAQTGEKGPPIAAAATAALSLGANLIFVFLTAPRGLLFSLFAAIVGAVVNGLLAFLLGVVAARTAARRDRSVF